MITYHELECPACLRKFKIRLSYYNYQKDTKGQRLFHCSSACSRTKHIKYVSGICQHCSQNFTRVSNGSKEKAKFCSQACGAKHISESRRSAGACKYCDNIIAWAPVKRLICADCRSGNSISKKTLRELKESYDKIQYHAKIRGHARQIYKFSRKPLSCLVCRYDFHVDVCHIKAVKEFDLSCIISEVNSINNLVALCKNHHWEFDHGALSLFR